MLTEQKLKAIEKCSAASEADGEQWVGIHIDDLTSLIAAARVANAAAILERERGDYERRRGPQYEGQQTRILRDRALAAFDRALRRYTDTVPTAGVFT